MTSSRSQKDIYDYATTILADHSDLKEEIVTRSIVPHQVEIHPPPIGLRACWLECSWCYGRYHKVNHKARIDSERLIQIVREICNEGEISERKANKVIFSGIATDPLFTVPGLMETLIKISNNTDTAYGIHSKLLQISDELIDNLVTGGRENEDYISISLDAGNSLTYNRIHNCTGDQFNRVLHNIKRITDRSRRGFPKIIVTYLLDEHNCDEDNITNVIGHCKNLGVQFLRFSIPQLPYRRDRSGQYQLLSEKKLDRAIELIQEETELNTHILEILFTDFAYESKTSERRVLPCYARWLFPTVSIDGFLYPCCQVASEEFKELRIANLTEVGFWDSYFKYEYPQDTYSMANSGCKCDRKALSVNRKLLELRDSMGLT